VGIRFSIFAGKVLSGASFTVAELKAHIESFIDSYNETAGCSPG
jgi:hypothetical protein